MSLLEGIEDDVLQAIKQNRPTELLSFLGCGMSINHIFTSTQDTNAHGLTLLHASILYGADRVMRQLIKKKCKLNKAAECVSFNGTKSKIRIKKSHARLPWTCLHRAILMQDMKVVRRLVHAGASVNFYDADRRTTLHYVVDSNNEALIRIILKSPRCKINHQDSKGRTALHLATKNRSVEIMKILLSCGAGVDHTDEEGSTALHVATRGNDVANVRTLLQYGADPNIKDRSTCTPLILTLAEGNSCILVRMLLTAGAFVYSHCMLQTMNELPIFQEDPEHHTYIQSYLDNTRSLKVLSSLSIKRVLKSFLHRNNLPGAVSQLPIPTALKGYLLLTELDDTQEEGTFYTVTTNSTTGLSSLSLTSSSN